MVTAAILDRLKVTIYGVLLFILAGCATELSPALPTPVGNMAAITLTSPVVNEGGSIPAKYTCAGDDLSLPLNWDTVPTTTKSLVLIVEDPDAPFKTWVHWVLYDIPPLLNGLPEGVAKIAFVEKIGSQGKNDFGKPGYGGPCPPSGKPHRYLFKLFALDQLSGLPPGATKGEIEKAMQGHILTQGQFSATFGR
jgi:Raf kinase inhibitor-like YbhB/YbcL family protein